MDVVTMNGDEFNRKGSISGGYHDERAARLLTLEKIRGLRKDLDALSKQRKDMQDKVRGGHGRGELDWAGRTRPGERRLSNEQRATWGCRLMGANTY